MPAPSPPRADGNSPSHLGVDQQPIAGGVDGLVAAGKVDLADQLNRETVDIRVVASSRRFTAILGYFCSGIGLDKRYLIQA
ncbi:hypothetical protein K9B32_08995 [Rhizobium sp. 3T7]|uniref:hypothetical protein n=1 Tax=Rhizobium sp. 3T7 TaxID=2874922 RepID=UPI001CCCBAA9|nr:hypothetical protein [Rhizobium sp. 3T7]MBZ9790266.1 hypothetical protein [Rhizobium sp. 3T7]